MDNKPQRRASALEQAHATLPPGTEIDDAELKSDPREYKAHQKAITKGLRKFFDTVAAEPVPEEFTALLRKMDEGGSER